MQKCVSLEGNLQNYCMVSYLNSHATSIKCFYSLMDILIYSIVLKYNNLYQPTYPLTPKYDIHWIKYVLKTRFLILYSFILYVALTETNNRQTSVGGKYVTPKSTWSIDSYIYLL